MEMAFRQPAMPVRLNLFNPKDLTSDANGVELDAVVFDCDGVLLETISAKLQAYVDWVPEAYKDLQPTFSKHNRRSFGQSRGVQIRYFYEELVKLESVSDAFLESEIQRFTEICEPLCEAAKWAEGAREFVLACNEAGSRTFVLSGTPQAELQGMLSQRNAMELFDKVIGFPITKEEGLERVVQEYGFDPERMLFVGDAQRDAEAAQAVGTHFVYVPSEADRPTCPILNETVNLLELLR